jgi:hypothetical protein
MRVRLKPVILRSTTNLEPLNIYTLAWCEVSLQIQFVTSCQYARSVSTSAVIIACAVKYGNVEPAPSPEICDADDGDDHESDADECITDCLESLD